MKRIAHVCNAPVLFAAALMVISLVGASAMAVSADKYSLVRVKLDSPSVVATLRANPDLDIAYYKPDSHVDIVARDRDMAWLYSANLGYDILHDDLAAYYASRAKGLNFGLFHTYSEAGDWLDQMHIDYPDVVSAKWSLGTSGEGRDIWCVRVSDNPEVDEANEPEILFDGMHHAREIMASEMVLMLIDHLGSEYGSDPEITWLLDNREIYLVPIVNPDGIVYNETTDPTGGGMWRKNRRDNGDGSFGVDPNRNYPFEWVGPGSSTDPSSDVYRGPSAGSEPEVQALMALVDAHAFVTSQSFHTYSNLTLYPWGYTTTDTPDSDLFVHMADIMTRYNGYATGQAPDLLYEVNGSTTDWIYGETSGHPVCFALTSEIGSSNDGFWPDESRRDALFHDNLWPSLYQIMCAGDFVRAEAASVVGGDGNGSLDPGETAGLAFSLENMGVTVDATNITVTLSTPDPYLQLHEISRAVGSLAAMATLDLTSAPFSASLDPACPDGRPLPVLVQITWDGGSVDHKLTYPAGSAQILFADDFEGAFTQWTTTGTWDLTAAQSHSTSSSLTDSPVGSYVDQTETSATIAAGVALPAGGTLTFWHRFDIEDGWDYGYVQISVDGGGWNTLASYTGLQTSWTEVSIDLADHIGDSVLIRFLLSTDYSVTTDGWYVDDVVIEGIGSSNQLPAAPALLWPLDGAYPMVDTLNLTCGTVTDPEGDPVTYGFRIYDSPDLTTVVFAVEDVAAIGAQAQVFPTGLTVAETYWWRAFAADTEAWGLLGDVRSFIVDDLTDVYDLALGLDLRRLDGTGGQNVRLSLNLPRSSDLSVTVFNARGQAVRTLLDGERAAGAHVLSWDGRDKTGRGVASGVYFVRARAGDLSTVSRILMVR